jgi:hypothetical protein
MTSEPKNESPICAAVHRFLEDRDGEKLSVVDQPDKTHAKLDRQPQAVELVLGSASSRFVIEHTRIESFEQQISDGAAFVRLLEPLEAVMGPDHLPSGKYDLIVDCGAAGLVPRAEAMKVRVALAGWVIATAPTLAAHPDEEGQWSVTSRPRDVPFDVTLQRWATKKPSRLLIERFTPNDLEVLRRGRIRIALDKKLPKLADAKRRYAAESILVLESDDIALASFAAIGERLRDELLSRADQPDTIYLVETDRGLSWNLWILKSADLVFPDVPDSGPFCLSSSDAS